MITKEKALLSEACAATGMDPNHLRETYVETRNMLRSSASVASEYFHQQALGAIRKPRTT
jgi:hypothetical protein